MLGKNSKDDSKRKSFNSYLLLGIIIFYFISYSFGSIYTPMKSYYSLVNILFFIALFIANFREYKTSKRIFVILVIQFIYALVCKYFNNTGWGSIIQILDLLFIIMSIPMITIDEKFYLWIKRLVPFIYLIFIISNKSHLNPNFVGYLFLCLYIISIFTYNLDSKGRKIYLIIFTIISLLLIHMFRCRTAMMSLILLFIMLQFNVKVFKNKYFKNLTPIFLVFASFALAALYIWLWKKQFLIGARTFFGKSFYSGRNRLWNEVLPLLLKHPLVGVGSKYHLITFEKYAMHNTTFMISLTFGLPSLMIYFYVIKDFFNKVFQKLKGLFSDKMVLCTLAVLLFNDIFESYIYWSNFNMLFFVMMIALLNRNVKQNISALSTSDKKKNKKNIYFFEEGIDRIGGVERVIATLSNNLSSKYNVNVISFYKNSSKIFYDYDKSVNIKFLSKYKEQKFKLKGNFASYYYYRIKKILSDIFILKPRLSGVLNTLSNEDIIILGRLDVALIVYPLIENCGKIIARDAIHYEYFKPIKRQIIKRLLNNDRINLIVSSDESKNCYLKNTKIKNIYKIYNPLGIIPINKFNLDAKTIVSIGRYSSQKGFELLIKAFKKVYEKKSDWKLRIIGPGNGKLKPLIEDLDLSKSVEILEKSDNVVYELNRSSIYVMASRYEGYANSLVEALSCGVPSISFNWLMGVDDIIAHEKTGLIVNLADRYSYAKGVDCEKDIDSLSKAILTLINDSKMCKFISKNAVSKINDTRDVKKIIEEWKKIIE